MANRNQLIKAIHVGRKNLGLSDDEYRALLEGTTKKNSLRQMNDAQLTMVLRTMRNNGFTSEERNAQIRMAYYLWAKLYEANVVQDSTSAALNTFAVRVVKMEMKKCDTYQLRKLIEALKQWATRQGVIV